MIRPSNVQTTHALSLPNASTNQSKSAIMKKISLFFAQQKIEEMTLYILQLEERVQQLENGKGGTR